MRVSSLRSAIASFGALLLLAFVGLAFIGFCIAATVAGDIARRRPFRGPGGDGDDKTPAWTPPLRQIPQLRVIRGAAADRYAFAGRGARPQLRLVVDEARPPAA